MKNPCLKCALLHFNLISIRRRPPNASLCQFTSASSLGIGETQITDTIRLFSQIKLREFWLLSNCRTAFSDEWSEPFDFYQQTRVFRLQGWGISRYPHQLNFRWVLFRTFWNSSAFSVARTLRSVFLTSQMMILIKEKANCAASKGGAPELKTSMSRGWDVFNFVHSLSLNVVIKLLSMRAVLVYWKRRRTSLHWRLKRNLNLNSFIN